MGSLSERCAYWLFARDDGIPWAWGAQVSSAKMVPALGIARRVGCYCGLVWASSRRGNERAVPIGSLSERCTARLFAHDDGIPWAWGAEASRAKMVPTLGIRCAARLFARDDGIPWAWGAQASRAQMVPALGTARWVGCYCGLVWASSRRGNERAIPMGSLSERCAARLFARDDGIPWAWGAQVSRAKVVSALSIAR
ncbi:hypothetical protein BUALT_Bualt07G0101200 [Buddleja alternifolia]|uniref:Uncharacterized protein n=1 Tax=Buddleja alternifolia TaxID=168488 RepID=A0AAV6XK74_9LAMI|nr:hypothetical protein BUALT_Bualt07G0101200 [Buddleja alternifolia]